MIFNFWLTWQKKIGVETKSLSGEEIEEIALGQLIKSGGSGKHVNEEKFIRSLQKKLK